MPFFIDILNKLKEKENIDYEIRFFYDYQKDYLVKKSLIKVIENYNILKNTLDPKSGEIRLRFPCPKCGLTEKHLWKTQITGLTDDAINMSSYCPIHGEY